MTEPAHKNHTKHFGELTYAEQANSINASILNLEHSITHHIKNAKDSDKVRQKCLDQLHGMIGRLK